MAFNWKLFSGHLAGEVADRMDQGREEAKKRIDKALDFGVTSFKEEYKKAEEDRRELRRNMAALNITGLSPVQRLKIAEGGTIAVKQALALHEKAAEKNINLSTIYKIKDQEAFANVSDEELLNKYKPLPEFTLDDSERYMEGRPKPNMLARLVVGDTDTMLEKRKEEFIRRSGLMKKPGIEPRGSLPETVGELEIDFTSAQKVFAPKEKEFDTPKKKALYLMSQRSKLDPVKDKDKIDALTKEIESLSEFETTFGKTDETKTIDDQLNELGTTALELGQEIRAKQNKGEDTTDLQEQLDNVKSDADRLRAIKEGAPKQKEFNTLEAYKVNFIKEKFEVQDDSSLSPEEKNKKINELDQRIKVLVAAQNATKKDERGPFSKQSMDVIIANALSSTIGNEYIELGINDTIEYKIKGKDITKIYYPYLDAIEGVREIYTDNTGYIDPVLDRRLNVERDRFLQGHIDRYKQDRFAKMQENILVNRQEGSAEKKSTEEVTEADTILEVNSAVELLNLVRKNVFKVGDLVKMRNPKTDIITLYIYMGPSNTGDLFEEFR